MIRCPSKFEGSIGATLLYISIRDGIHGKMLETCVILLRVLNTVSDHRTIWRLNFKPLHSMFISEMV